MSLRPRRGSHSAGFRSSKPARRQSELVRKRRNGANRRLRLEKLCDRRVMAADPIISEVASSVAASLDDEDGDSSDWIEIFNAGNESLDLGGWALTDDPTEPDQWRFPATTTLGPGEFLVVFASGKDRTDPGGNLHTNFRLSADGEYLGLLTPDLAIADQYAPTLPGLRTDVSYGPEFQVESVVQVGDDARYFVPSDASLGNSWTQVGFDDSSWSSGPTGIGFGISPPGFDVTYVKARPSGAFDGIVNSLAIANQVLATPAYQQSVAQARTETINFRGTGSGGNFGNDMAFPSQNIGDDVDHFVIRATTQVQIPAAGVYSFGVNSDDGFSLSLSGSAGDFSSEFPGTRAARDTIEVFNITEPGAYDLELVMFEAGGGASVELFAAPGIHTAFNASVFDLVGDVAAGGLSAGLPYIAGNNPWVATDIAVGMRGSNASVYVRREFDVQNAQDVSLVEIQAAYDDGFVAYINGVEVARRNAPTTIDFDSSATAAREPNDAVLAETIVLDTGAAAALVDGTNVLAIQGLNSTPSDTSFLLSTELRVVGFDADGDRFFETPTPGTFNVDGALGFLEPVGASVGAGFYESTQNVVLTTASAGATIIYTTDGSDPTPENSLTYSGPLAIDATTVLRAAAVRDDYIASPSTTWTYLFLDDVLLQSNDGSAPDGFPDTWKTNVVDYGMDPDVINAVGPQAVKDALLSLPTWTINTDIDNLFDPDIGIYSNARQTGRDWERPASFELIHPDGTEGFQINGGVRIRGGFSRNDFNAKHSFRLFFRNEYGASSLEYPLHGPDAADTFEKIDLRTAQNYSWSSRGNASNQFITEYFSRKNQALMGEPATNSRWVHLYLNGQYWGLFQTQERSEARYAETYFGGDADDYDVIKPERGPNQNFATDGNMDAYTRLYNAATARAADGFTPAFVDDAAYLAVQGLAPDGTRDPNLDVLVDVDNLIVYMIEILRGGNFDAPISKFRGNRQINNYFAIYNRNGEEGFQYFVHDAEHTMRDLDGTNRLIVNRNGPYNDPNFDNSIGNFNPQWLHQQLMANTEYRLRFADIVQANLFGAGPTTVDRQIESWNTEAAALETAVIAESARWGDAHSSRTNNPIGQADYLNAIADIRDNYLPFRNGVLVDQLRETVLALPDGQGGYTRIVPAPLYPSLGAPQLRIDGTEFTGDPIAPGDRLSMAGPQTIYYTTDGSDPRLPGGALSPSAIEYVTNSEDLSLIELGQQWSYDDTGSDLGTTWMDAGFDDSGWATGVGEFGYGDGDEATVISFGGDAANKHITSYFRKSFTVDRDDATSLTLRIRRDDGIVVYLNGVEVARDNLPAGIIDYQTTANSAIGGAAESSLLTFTLDPSLLLLGQNVLAVELHQFSPTSSDTSFDAELSASFGDLPNIVLQDSTTINARALDAEGTWSALSKADFVVPRTPATAGSLRVTEVHYHPLEDEDAEFIELLNVTSGAEATILSLADLTLVEGPSSPLQLDATAELSPGQYGLLVKDIDAFQSVYPDVDPAIILGEYSGSLRNSGEEIELRDASDELLVRFDYSDRDPWSRWADGAGGSLVSVDPLGAPLYVAEKSYAWRSSGPTGGTPGAADPGLPGVVITEVLSHTDLPLMDAIELHNSTSGAIDIGGWFLSDDDDELPKFVIPAGTILPAGGYIVFDESDFNPTPDNPLPNHFALSGSQGETIWLTRGEAGQVVGLADFASFDATFNGVSVGRTPDIASRLLPLAQRSLGGPNGESRTPDVYLSEVHFHPEPPSTSALAIDSTIEESDLEFIEIANSTQSDIDLLHYQITGQTEFTFGDNHLLAAGASLVLVPFDPELPTNALRVQAFRNQYGMDETLALVGPLSDSLGNSEGIVRLRAPDAAPVDEPTVTPRVLVDEVFYDDRSPWPETADGDGPSLQRVDFNLGGNEVDAWRAVSPTPGTTRLVPKVDNIQINDGRVTRSEITALSWDVSVPVDAPDEAGFSLVDADGNEITAIDVIAQPHEAGTRIRLTFAAGAGIIDRAQLPNTLADGDYELRIAPGALVAVTGAAGNEDEIVFGQGAADGFFRKYGDSDGSGSVNLLDFADFRQSFGLAVGDLAFEGSFDANGDGTVDLLDFADFRTNFGT
ncbi:MAG: lamin tail domain-containing protein [Planctomycetota bacterium]